MPKLRLVITDLFGKEIKPPREPAPMFYCHHCTATYSQRCKKCGEQLCGNARKHCPRDPHECPTRRVSNCADTNPKSGKVLPMRRPRA